MNRRQFCRAMPLAVGFLGAYRTSSPSLGKSGERGTRTKAPNLLFILVDDLGWRELGCCGSDFNETPHIDALAREGTRFANAYAAAPVCSPYRASLMTGQAPARVGITDYLRPNDTKHLSADLPTLPQMLSNRGYATGILGKWHLTGYASAGAEEIGPDAHGFQEVLLSETHGIAGGSYFHPYHFNPSIEKRLPGQEYLVDRMHLEALEFLERHKNEPFFLYLSHYAIHTRLLGRPDLVKKYEMKAEEREQAGNPHLAAMLESVDEGVGQMIAKLEELGIRDNTFVVFASDNGGEDRVASNLPLRAGKSTLYEGGIRVPLLMAGPGIQRNHVCPIPVSSVDLYPTLLQWAGVPLPTETPLDGVSLASVLSGKKKRLERERPLFWHYPLERPHFLGGKSSGAIQEDGWKLIEFFDTGKSELYHLAQDEGETQDLSKDRKDKVEALKQKLQACREAVGATVPEPLKTLSLFLAGKNRLLQREGKNLGQPQAAFPLSFDGKTDLLDLPRSQAPQVKGHGIQLEAKITCQCQDGVILAHGGNRHGYALYARQGCPSFSVCADWEQTTIQAKEALGDAPVKLKAHLSSLGEMELWVDGRSVARGQAASALVADPGDSLQIGGDRVQPVGEYQTPNRFRGVLHSVTLNVE